MYSPPTDPSNPCHFCGKTTKLYCKDCSTFYCNVQCIRMDAENHKTFCNKLTGPEDELKMSKNLYRNSVPLFENSRFAHSKNLCLTQGEPTNFDTRAKFPSKVLTLQYYPHQLDQQSNDNSVTEFRVNQRIVKSLPYKKEPKSDESKAELTPRQSSFATYNFEERVSRSNSSVQGEVQNENFIPEVKPYQEPQKLPINQSWNLRKEPRLYDTKNLPRRPHSKPVEKSPSLGENIEVKDNHSPKPKTIVKEDVPKDFTLEEAEAEIKKKPDQIPIFSLKKEPFEPGCVENVIFLYLCESSEGDVWVIREKDCSKLENLHVQLNLPELSFSNIKTSPTFGDHFLKLYDDSWWRVRVTKPNPLTVIFIDYGNTEVCKLSDLRELPEEFNLKNYPPLVKLVKFVDKDIRKDDLKINEKTTICIRSVQGEIYLAELKQANEDESKPKDKDPVPDLVKLHIADAKSSSTLRSAISMLPVGCKGRWFQSTFTSTDLVGAIHVDFIDEESLILSNVNLPKITPKVGDLVMACTHSGPSPSYQRWFRGLVLRMEKANIYVALIDQGRIIATSQVADVPDYIKTVPYLAAMWNFDDLKDQQKTPEKVDFTVLQECNSRGVLCSISSTSDGNQSTQAYLAEWKIEFDKVNLATCEVKELVKDIPKSPANTTTTIVSPAVDHNEYDEFEPQHLLVGLESGRSLVKITYWKSTNQLSLMRWSSKIERQHNELYQDICVDCAKGKPLTEMPRIGGVVGAMLNNIYHRGLVLSHEANQMLKIRFIDIGKVESVPLTNLRCLSAASRKHPCFVTDVKLKNVPDTACEKAVRVLNDALKNIFLVNFDNLSEGVTLIDNERGLQLNSILVHAIEGDIKNPQLPKGLMVTDLTFRDFPEGNVSLVILNVDPITSLKGIFYAVNFEEDFLNAFQLMQSQINDYCQNLPQEPYKPRLHELCLALYQDYGWFRAYAMNDDDSMNTKLYFVDYGNTETINNADIRPMTETYLKFPAIAQACVVKNFEKFSKDKQQKMIELLKTKENVPVDNMIVRKVPGSELAEVTSTWLSDD